MFLLVTHTESGFWEFLKRYYQNNSYSKKRAIFRVCNVLSFPIKGKVVGAVMLFCGFFGQLHWAFSHEICEHMASIRQEQQTAGANRAANSGRLAER